ncbi:MAG: nucleoside/nucleotide kinase family protein, partial [Acidimicrobiales bacterium]
YAPHFDRAIEEPIAGAVAVERHVPLVVTEGNYLLSEQSHWDGVRPLLDTCWYLDLDDELRQRRLAARHESYGRSPREALGRTLGSDQANADLVTATRHRADLVITLRAHTP